MTLRTLRRYVNHKRRILVCLSCLPRSDIFVYGIDHRDA
jgi:hypothetical protein